MSNEGVEQFQLQDRPRGEPSVNLSTSALPLHNNPQDSHFGSASVAAGRGHAHPTEPSSSAAGDTFFQHLQHKLRGGGEPRVRYRCNADRYRGPHMNSSPWVGRKHDCINFESVSVFEEAKEYYYEARQRNATSVRAVKALALILLLVPPLLPFTLLALPFWTFRVVSHLIGVIRIALMAFVRWAFTRALLCQERKISSFPSRCTHGLLMQAYGSSSFPARNSLV